MQQVVVPQFLDVEDKIIGPITVRQFLELLVSAILIIIFYKILDFAAFVVCSLVLFSLTVILAFAKINGQPFHLFLLNFVQTLRRPKLQVWRKSGNLANDLRDQMEKPISINELLPSKKTVSASKISEIALIIDTGGIYQGENGSRSG